MISKKDAEIISHLRNNARKKITNISREMKIPVTTIYDRVKSYEKKFVTRHVSLLDFPKLGLHAKANIAIKVERDSREALQEFLMQHPNVNSLSKVNFGSDFLAEVVFRNTGEVQNFTEKLEKDFQSQIQVFNIIDELKKEDFLTRPEHLDVLG